MKRITLFIAGIAALSSSYAQTTWESVYNVLQTNCGSCHVAGHESGLDLSASIGEVYDNLYNLAPSNATSAAKGYKRVFPGEPYKSFLFSKVNNELAWDVNLEAGEGAACPQGAAPLNNKDIELIRQWIMFGAFESDTAVDIALINEFYDNDGIQSVPSPPAPPAAGEGFQVHFGPFFLYPEDEHEYFTKFYTQIPTDQEIIRVDTYMGDYSHHFITYRYTDAFWIGATPYGLHDGPDFVGIDLVTANQYPQNIELPEGTAFNWVTNTVLNLNSHYINYSPDKALACEAYVNIYTQPVGTAVQTMYSVLLSNSSFYVPNDGLPHTDIASEFENGHGDDELFVWAMSCHTHQYGSDFNIYKRTEDGDTGEQIFDGACGATEGVPGCLDEIYDYKHPPTRYWESMLPIKWGEGIKYETTWINDGPEPVGFGLTSEDEMMVMMYFYVDDTTGLNLPAAVAINEPGITPLQVEIFPNPASEMLYIKSLLNLSGATISLTDMSGKIVRTQLTESISTQSNYYQVNINDLSSGIYLINLTDVQGNVASEKIVIQ
jgi:hypothetical protein